MPTGLAQLIWKYNYNYVLAYANTINEANRFCEICRNVGLIAETYSGNTPVKKRELINELFCNGEIRVLVTVYTLSEGIDLPQATCCLFVQPRHSYFNVLQCIGRVLRNCENKRFANIIVPNINIDGDNVVLNNIVKTLHKYDNRIAKEYHSGKQCRIVPVLCNCNVNTDAELINVAIHTRFRNN